MPLTLKCPVPASSTKLLAPSCQSCKSPSSPIFAFTLSPNFKLLSDLSNTILFPFAVIRVTSSFNVVVPETSTLALISTLPPYVETPVTLTWSIFAPPTTSRRLFTSTRAVKVETPVTLRSSNCVSPSTSKVLLISTAEENVDTPATLRSSNCVSPSTSKVPLASIATATVVTPVTFRLSKVDPPTIFAPPSTSRSVVIWALPVTVNFVPLNVKLPLSSISPPVPARTTLPDVKSSTLNVFAWPPALISTADKNVETPVTLSWFRLPGNTILPLELIRSLSVLPFTQIFKLDEPPLTYPAPICKLSLPQI